MNAYTPIKRSRVRQVKDTSRVIPSGNVFVSFTVTSQEILEAAEAVWLAQSLPPCNSGRQAGRAVNVRYDVGIKFSER